MQYTDKFLEFWNYYPRRKNDSKSKTFGKWEKLGLEDNFDEVMKAVKTYKQYKEVKQGYNKGILVWVNQRMWETINEEQTPFQSTTTGSQADEETQRIVNNVINPLIAFFGEPDWLNYGRNTDHIINKWTGAFKHCSLNAISKGLDDLYVSRTYTSFPSLSEVYKHIDKYRYLDNNNNNTIIKEASDWYEYTFLDDETPDQCMTSKRKVLYELIDRLKTMENCSNYSFAKLVERMWQLSLIQNNFDTLYNSYKKALTTKSKTSKVREWLKKAFISYKGSKEYENKTSNIR